MGTGIQICGLNGSGKSTLGRALAQRIEYHFIDNEALYFSKTDSAYEHPVSRKTAEERLMAEVAGVKDFVFAAVRGDYGEKIISQYKCVVVVETPRAVRLQRIKERSFQKFGNRMLPGGDLYENERLFFERAKARPDDYVEAWLETLSIPVFRVDGTEPIRDNVDRIVNYLYNIERTRPMP